MARMGRQLILEIACLFVTLYATADSLATAKGEACETPDNYEGECIELKKCPKLLALKDSFRSDNETAFLEASGCRRDDPVAHVCCRYETIDLLPDSRVCGQDLPHLRITGGSSTHINEYPWTALISFERMNGTGIHYCGGTLINNRYVLSAASCLWLQNCNMIKAPVRLGEWDLTMDKDCEEGNKGQKYCADPHLDFAIEELILHPDFRLKNLKHNIALIRLNRYVNFTDFIQPVCLPILQRLRIKTYDSVRMIAVGWGKTSYGVHPAKKQKIFLPGVNLDTCRKITGLPLLDTNMCAGGLDATICDGDAGGPLLYQQSVDFRHVFVLVGITSVSLRSCIEHGGTGVFTRVGPYMDWIKKNLKP